VEYFQKAAKKVVVSQQFVWTTKCYKMQMFEENDILGWKWEFWDVGEGLLTSGWSFGKFEQILGMWKKIWENWSEFCCKFEKIGTNFEKIGTNFEKIGTNFEKIGTNFEKIGTDFVILDTYDI
jgi:hypothetical protein